jgi:ABC transport system ATP-binding/permease protein
VLVPPRAASAAPVAPITKPRKLSFKEQRELDELPQRIDRLEGEQKDLGKLLADPDVYRRETDRAVAAQARYAQIDAELTTALERWEALGQRS